MRALIVAAVLFGGVSAAAGTKSVTERDLRQAMGYAQRGLSALQKGNVARAREDFERAVVKIPELPDAHVGLGHLAMRERRFEDALREYRLAETGSKDIGTLMLLLENDRFSRSRDELMRLKAVQMQLAQAAMRSRTVSQSTTTGTGGFEGGQIFRETTEVENRIRALEALEPPTADTLAEPSPDVLFFQGNALFDLKRTGEAISVWEAAAPQLKEFGPIHNNLAVAYWKTGKLDAAWTSLRRAEAIGFKVNPNFKADLEKAGAPRAADSSMSSPTTGSPRR